VETEVVKAKVSSLTPLIRALEPQVVEDVLNDSVNFVHCAEVAGAS